MRRCSEAVSLSERDPRGEAKVLVRKAEDDANAMRLLARKIEILDAIPGSWERTQEGLAQARRGEGIPLDELT
jgi:hypothetical protein